MARKKKNTTKRPIESYEHTDKKRANNPPVGLVTPDTDPDAGAKRGYSYDPHLDPQLVWAGKAEHTSFEVPTVSLHVHERIDPRTIIEAVRRLPSPAGRGAGGEGSYQLPLFEAQEENPPLREAVEFYKHAHGWSNRMVAGDSLLVMNSLLEKEGLAGKVQMVYIDPPYGIRYGSNFQPFVNKRDVKDGKDEDLTAEPEQIRAFRDTWELGIHSYLTYLRDRLLLARELLTESGSIFVQISDENVHHVRELMDEVFGAGNFCAIIPFRKKTMPLGTRLLEQMDDFLLWYARSKESCKYRPLYFEMTGEGDWHYQWAEIANGSTLRMTKEQVNNHSLLPKGARLFMLKSLEPSGPMAAGMFDYDFEGAKYHHPKNGYCTTPNGMKALAAAGRLAVDGRRLAYKLYVNDWSVSPMTSPWQDTIGPRDKRFVVQTSHEVIQRCLLMTTDPGDLVFDPTCGSGTTAYVAEKWGRRWITCDTSRVALTLAKQRLMTATFDYYELAYPEDPHPNPLPVGEGGRRPGEGVQGVWNGFKYKTVPHVTLKSIANNPDIKEGMTREQIDAAIARHAPQETLYDQPLVDRKKHRVSGPFTVEAVPAPAVKSVEDVLLPSPAGRGVGGEGKKPLDPELLEFARKLRKEQTDAERLLWGLLRDRRLAGFKFRRQHPVEPYVLDFYCHEAQLAVELDGGQHNEPDSRARDRKRSAFLEQQGMHVLRFWNNEVFENTEGVLQAIYDALTPTLSQREREFQADASIARSGETLRQGEWRDELLRAGIRGKAGQHIRFARLEPLPGCRHLHADGETRPNDAGADQVREGGAASEAQRIVVSFGPEHAPLEQRQVAQAVEEAQLLVPKPRLIVFAAFQFDPEAAKDIDETNWPGVTLLKAQMNADLLTDDLKKKRASNESFWLIGQPDVEVSSFEFLVFGEGKHRIAEYGTFKKLSGLDRLEEIHRLSWTDLFLYALLSQGRDVWAYLADQEGWDFRSGECCGRPGQKLQGGVPSVSWNSPGITGGIGDIAYDLAEFGISDFRGCRSIIDRLQGNREIVGRLEKIAQILNFPIAASTKNWQLKTKNLHCVAVHGFDYYNTKTGGIESGGADKIAVWLLDTDYDGRSLYPRQVFFPMAGAKQGWARLAKNLKAEIDEELIQAYRGTVSLPFEAGEYNRIAVKIVDDRGIESLKVMEVE